MRKYVTRHQVRHGGKRVPIGSVLELSDQDAKDLGDAVVPHSPGSADSPLNVASEEQLKLAVIARDQAEARVEAEAKARADADARAEAAEKALTDALNRAAAAERALAEASIRAETAEKALSDAAATAVADGKGGRGKTAALV